VTGGHLRLKVIAHAEGGNNGMKEYGRLGNFSLAQVFICSVEHNISNTIPEDIICFLKKFLG
jgi:hypothetical protein